MTPQLRNGQHGILKDQRRGLPRGSLPSNVYRRSQVSSPPVQGGLEGRCEIKEHCGHCQFVNQEYHSSLIQKHRDGIAQLAALDTLGKGRILPPVASPKILGYRSIFKLAVRPAKDSTPNIGAPQRFAIGLFEQGSHDVINVDQCPLHTPPLRRLLKDLRIELEASDLTPYDEATGLGDLRYVVARSAHLTGEIMITFVVTASQKLPLRNLVNSLLRRDHRINAAYMNLNDSRGNAIFGAETINLSGSERMRERLLDLDFEIGPTSFFQINPWQAQQLYRRIEQIAGTATGERVAWDLYCGVGQISLVLARLGYKVLGVEEIAKAIVDATNNARRNHLEHKAEFVAGKVEDNAFAYPQWAHNVDLIVVNPSRRGLAPDARSGLAKILQQRPQARLLYVSCEAETLARDLAEILPKSGFRLKQLESFDMFPQTAKMEWLAVLTR